MVDSLVQEYNWPTFQVYLPWIVDVSLVLSRELACLAVSRQRRRNY